MKATLTKPQDAFAWQIPDAIACDVYIFIFLGAAGSSVNLKGKVKKRGGAIEIWDGANHISLSGLQPIKMWERTLTYGDGDMRKDTIVEVSVSKEGEA